MKTKSKNYTKIKVWDEDNFEMSNSNIKVRFISFIEEVHKKDKVEIKQSWIIITGKFTSVEILWKIMHKRWDIKDNKFHSVLEDLKKEDVAD